MILLYLCFFLFVSPVFSNIPNHSPSDVPVSGSSCEDSSLPVIKSKRVLIPIPSYGFDPSEAAIPWHVLAQKGVSVTFATPDGQKAAGDKIMLTGETLGPLKSLLMAREDAVEAYKIMEQAPSFNNPAKWADVKEEDFDALLLPGGHDKAVKPYLESKVLQQLVVSFFNAKRPVGAICHGVVLAARSIDPKTQKSVIYDYKITAVLKKQEKLAYYMTWLWLGDYYLTYPETTVEDELKSVLVDEKNFLSGPLPWGKDDPENLKSGFFVKDRNFLSARWPGDVYNFAFEFIKMVDEAKK